MMIAFPVIANQLWKFVAPGLYRKERRALLPFIFATPVLFTAGACMAYFVTVPVALKFLLGYQGDMGGIQQEALPSVANYLSFIMQFIMAFGIAFLLPIFLMLIERSGLVPARGAADPALRNLAVRDLVYPAPTQNRRRSGACRASRRGLG